MKPNTDDPSATASLTMTDQQVLDTLQKDPVKVVIRAAYEDDRPSKFISDRLHIPAVVLPFTIGGTDASKNLFSLYDDTISRLLAAAKG